MNIIDLAEYRITSGQETDTHSDVQIIEKLLAVVRSLQTCEKWLQGQVAERDAYIKRMRSAASHTDDAQTEWKPPQQMTIGPLCWQLCDDGRYTFIDGAVGGRYQCGASESLLVKRLAAAQQDLDKLRTALADST